MIKSPIGFTKVMVAGCWRLTEQGRASGGIIFMKSQVRPSAWVLGILAGWCVCAAMLIAARKPADDEHPAPAAVPAQNVPAQIGVKREDLHVSPIQVDVNMVVVNVTVTDPYDRIVTGLDQSNFQVFDEKVEQEIVSFSTEDAPIAVGLIFDSSGSMGDKDSEIQGGSPSVLQDIQPSR